MISLPASEVTSSRDAQPDDVEVGGRRGREALNCLRNVIGRVESPWLPGALKKVLKSSVNDFLNHSQVKDTKIEM